MNLLGAPIGFRPNWFPRSSLLASGSAGMGTITTWVGLPTSVASPCAARVFRHFLRLSSRAERRVSGQRVVAPNQQTDNNGLERTRSRANGLTGPCRSIQCCAGLRWVK